MGHSGLYTCMTLSKNELGKKKEASPYVLECGIWNCLSWCFLACTKHRRPYSYIPTMM